MDNSRILLIGNKGPFRTSTFANPPNLEEFSAVIWYPHGLRAELVNTHGTTVISKVAELIDWVKRGNSLVIIGAPPEEFSVAYVKDRTQHSFDLLKGELFKGVNFRSTTGRLVEFCGSDELAGFLSPLTNLLAYDAILTGSDLIPFFRVSTSLKSAPQIVGAYRKVGAGIVVYAPILKPDFRDTDIAPTYAYLMNLTSILESQQAPLSEELPDWARRFQTEGEREIESRISKAQEEIRKQDATIEICQNSIAKEQASKMLFTATGDAFAHAVAEGLRELGLHVVEGPKQRADLIARSGTLIAALEVKGLDGGAREKNVGQVKRWTADLSVALSTPADEVTDSEIKSYQDKLANLGIEVNDASASIDCKSILILNTYRKMPLQERPESYPEPVRKIVVRSGVCALTGLQLFLILQEVKNSPEKRQTFIDRLFETNGLLDGGLLWSSYLSNDLSSPTA